MLFDPRFTPSALEVVEYKPLASSELHVRRTFVVRGGEIKKKILKA